MYKYVFDKGVFELSSIECFREVEDGEVFYLRHRNEVCR